jgi:hypothetical protein
MNRVVGLWMLVGLAVACCWAVVALLLGPHYNLGHSALVAITAPASLLGRKMPLGVAWFILLNGGMYGLIGIAIEIVRRSHVHR